VNVRYTVTDFVSLHRHVFPTLLLLYPLLSVMSLEAGLTTDLPLRYAASSCRQNTLLIHFIGYAY